MYDWKRKVVARKECLKAAARCSGINPSPVVNIVVIIVVKTLRDAAAYTSRLRYEDTYVAV
jgi:hypothetical protein